MTRNLREVSSAHAGDHQPAVTHQLKCLGCMQLPNNVSSCHECATIAGKRMREPIPGVKAPPKVTTGGQHSDTPAAKVQRVDSGTPSASTRKLSTQRRELGHCADVVRCKYLLPCRVSSPAGAPLLQCSAMGYDQACELYCAAVRSRC